MRRSAIVVVFCTVLPISMPASAAQRTFVASTGMDSNPCTLPLPCRTFAAAMTLADPNGEIVVLDSAGYGPVTITKAVSIVAPLGVYAGISVPAAQDGVTVNAGAGDKVVLHGLTINGQGGDHGILVAAGSDIHIEDCTIANLTVSGIQIDGGSAVYIFGSTIRDIGTKDGIRVAPGAGDVFVDSTRILRNEVGIYVQAGRVTLNHVTVENNYFDGLFIFPAGAGTATVAVHDSMFVGNGGDGIDIFTNTGLTANVTISGTASLRNGFAGFDADALNGGTINLAMSGSIGNQNTTHGLFAYGAAMSLSDSTLSGNTRYGVTSTAGTFSSHGNNAAEGNGWGNTTGVITNIGLF